MICPNLVFAYKVHFFWIFESKQLLKEALFFFWQAMYIDIVKELNKWLNCENSNYIYDFEMEAFIFMELEFQGPTGPLKF